MASNLVAMASNLVEMASNAKVTTTAEVAERGIACGLTWQSCSWPQMTLVPSVELGSPTVGCSAGRFITSRAGGKSDKKRGERVEGPKTPSKNT